MKLQSLNTQPTHNDCQTIIEGAF